MRIILLLAIMSFLCSQLSGEVFYRLTSGLDDSLSYTEARISLFSQGSLVRVINGNNNRSVDVVIRQQQNTPGIKLSLKAFNYLEASPGETLLVRLVRAAKPVGMPPAETSTGINLSDIEQPPRRKVEATGQKDNTLVISTPEDQEEIPLFDRRRPQRQSWDNIRTEQRSPLAAEVPSSPSSTDEIRQMRKGEVLTLDQFSQTGLPPSQMPDSGLPPSPSPPRGPTPQPLWPETRVIRQENRSDAPPAPSARPQVNNPRPEVSSKREMLSLVPPPVPLPRAVPALPLLPSERGNAELQPGEIYPENQAERPARPGAVATPTGRGAITGKERTPAGEEVWIGSPSLPHLPPSGSVLRVPSSPLHLPSLSAARLAENEQGATTENTPTDNETWSTSPTLPHLPPSGSVLRTPSSPLAPPPLPPFSASAENEQGMRTEDATIGEEVWTVSPPLPPSPPSGSVLRTPSSPLAPPLAPPQSQSSAGERLLPKAEGNKTLPLYEPDRWPLDPVPHSPAFEGNEAPSTPLSPATSAPLPRGSIADGGTRPSYYIQVGVYRKLSSMSRFLATYSTTFPYQIDRVQLNSKVARRCLLGPFSLSRAQAILPRIKHRVHDAYLVDQRRHPYRATRPAR